MLNKVRTAATFAAAALIMSSLAACGTGDSGTADDGTSAGPEGTAENPVTLRFRWWGSEDRQARQLEVIELFEEENPDIRVTPEATSLDGYFDQLGVEMAGRNAPDVFTLGGAYPLEYGSRGALLDLAQAPSLDITPFSAAVLTDATIGDQVFGVPTGGNATGIIVNRDVFAAAGVELPDDDAWTWEDFTEIAEQLSEGTPDGTYGAELRPQDFLGAYAAQRDGKGLYDTDGSLSVEASTLEDFLVLFETTMTSGASPEATLYSELVNAGPEQTLMGRGLAGMIFAPSNQIEAFSASSGADLALLRIPGESEYESVGTAVLPSQWFAIAAGTDYPESASRFVDFLVNDERAGAILGVDRGNPLNADVATAISSSLTPIQQETVDFMSRVMEHAGQAIAQPNGAGEQPAITQRAVDSVIFDRSTPEQAAQTWLNEMQAALDAAS